MTSSGLALIIDDLSELIALDKALREAKFSDAPEDPAVAASPIVASLSRRVDDAIGSRVPGHSKTMVEPGRREWIVSLRTAIGMVHWSTWSTDKQALVAVDLLRPYGVSEENLALFLSQVDAARQDG